MSIAGTIRDLTALGVLPSNIRDIPSGGGIAFAIVDDAGRRSWLEVDVDGGPTLHAVQMMDDALQTQGYGSVTTGYKSTYSDASAKIVSGPDIVCWGDSMTAGAGGGGTTYPSVLASLLSGVGYTGSVRNSGVGGEGVTITARSGATPFIVDVTGGSIPASGGVTITFRQINGSNVAPLLQGDGNPDGGMTGPLKGVLGTITYDSATTTYTFTRTTAGSAVTCDRPEAFRTDYSEARRGDIYIIWIGQNIPSNDRAIQDARAMVEHMTALSKRYIVVSKPTSTDTDDAAWHAEFGRRFLAIRKYMVEFGLQDAGITPTTQDNTDMANGVVPTSLRSDSVHWTAAGYTIMGQQVFNRIRELGWV